MNRRATQQDVARAAGVHRTTVSLVLKNHPSIPEATRARIRLIAREIGYVPDPALSALVAYRTHHQKKVFQGNLAWFSPSTHLPLREQARLRTGAAERALELGYHLEDYPSLSSLHQARETGRILQARGIRGGLLLPQNDAEYPVINALISPRLALVAVGFSPSAPPLHSVIYSQAHATLLAFHTLRHKGYRRIGFVFPPHPEEASALLFLKGYLHEHLRDVPYDPFLSHWKYFPTAWQTWKERYQPEALVVGTIEIATRLESLGENLPLAVVGTDPGQPRHQGVNQHLEEVGRLSVNQLVDLIHQYRFGIPPVRHRVVVEGSWDDGIPLLC